MSATRDGGQHEWSAATWVGPAIGSVSPNGSSGLCGLVIVMITLLILLSLPLETRVEFGGDEGIELMKGLLVSRGFTLYEQIWSDQPPLFTSFIALSLKIGESAFWPRMISVGCTTMLLILIFRLTSTLSNSIGGVFACMLFLCNHLALTLSVSAMQEVPMLSFGMLSAYLLLRNLPSERTSSVVWSALFMAIALQIKFTAILIYLAVSLAGFVCVHTGWPGFARRVVAMSIHWSMTLGACLALSFVLGSGTIYESVGTHFLHLATGSAHDFPLAQAFRFSFSDVVAHLDIFIAAGIGAVFLSRTRARNEIAWFVITLFLCQLIFALCYRPWWGYYFLSLSLPLVILAGAGISGMIAYGQVFDPSGFRPGRLLALAFGVAAAIAFALLSISRLANAHAALRREPPIENRLEEELTRYSTVVKWMYSESPALSFHAGICIPPEIAVITLKRIWSGQIDRTLVRDVALDYDIELILLRKVGFGYFDENYLADEFVETWSEGEYRLLVKRGVPLK